MRTCLFSGKEEMNRFLFSGFLEDVNTVLQNDSYMNLGIATGNTYSCFFQTLSRNQDIPLDRINLFMVDEYTEIDPIDKKSCAYDLIKEVTCIDSFRHFYTFTQANYFEQINEYNAMLNEHPFDLLLLGIGNNGHYGFCQKNEKKKTKDTYAIINFTEEERRQQVDLGWFDDIAEVPSSGISITEYGVWRSKKVIFAAYYDQKKKIIDQILQNRVSPQMAIYPLLSKPECQLLYG